MDVVIAAFDCRLDCGDVGELRSVQPVRPDHKATEGNAADCVTMGILPGEDASRASPAVDVPVISGMGDARNNVNALTGEVMIVSGIGLGTASEIALALKAGKNVIMLGGSAESRALFTQMGAQAVSSVEEAIEAVKTHLVRTGPEGAVMIQLKAKESEGAIGLTAHPRGHLSIQKQEGLELSPGDELLLQIEGLGTNAEGYDLAVILTDSAEPEEDEFLLQYGDKFFVAQKAPDHI